MASPSIVRALVCCTLTLAPILGAAAAAAAQSIAVDRQRGLQMLDQAAAVKPKQEWLAPGVLYWRMPHFFLDVFQLASQVDKRGEARQLVLDLRGDPGGRIHVLGIAAFAGSIVVLVDSQSGSCAEMLAYFLQQRGAKVIGDRTDGLVRGSQTKKHAAGDGDYKVLYAVQVTLFDIAMADGVRLEGRGVRPDVVSLPTADDLEQRLDPVLSAAAATFGVTIDSQRAGRLSGQ